MKNVIYNMFANDNIVSIDITACHVASQIRNSKQNVDILTMSWALDSIISNNIDSSIIAMDILNNKFNK